jgi:hypothetical protein
MCVQHEKMRSANGSCVKQSQETSAFMPKRTHGLPFPEQHDGKFSILKFNIKFKKDQNGYKRILMMNVNRNTPDNTLYYFTRLNLFFAQFSSV